MLQQRHPKAGGPSTYPSLRRSFIRCVFTDCVLYVFAAVHPAGNRVGNESQTRGSWDVWPLHLAWRRKPVPRDLQDFGWRCFQVYTSNRKEARKKKKKGGRPLRSITCLLRPTGAFGPSLWVYLIVLKLFSWYLQSWGCRAKRGCHCP